MIRRLTDLAWPTLERPNAERRSAAETALLADVQAIEACSFATASREAYEEARRLATDEDDRRRGAEARASGYLLVIAALIPLLTYLEGTVWGRSFGQAPQWLSLLVLAVAVLYLLGAGRWAFRTLRIGSYARIDGNDLATIWGAGGTGQLETLTKRLLSATRRNRAAVDDKVTGIKMAHIFLSRSILWFGILLLTQVAWYFFPSVVEWTGGKARDFICRPSQAANRD